MSDTHVAHGWCHEQSLGDLNSVRDSTSEKGDLTESGPPGWGLGSLPSFWHFHSMGLGDAQGRAWVGHASRPQVGASGTVSSGCQPVASVWPVSHGHHRFPSGNPDKASRLTSSSTCTLRREQSRSTVGCTNPPGAWRGWGTRLVPWACFH